MSRKTRSKSSANSSTPSPPKTSAAPPSGRGWQDAQRGPVGSSLGLVQDAPWAIVDAASAGGLPCETSTQGGEFPGGGRRGGNQRYQRFARSPRCGDPAGWAAGT